MQYHMIDQAPDRDFSKSVRLKRTHNKLPRTSRFYLDLHVSASQTGRITERKIFLPRERDRLLSLMTKNSKEPRSTVSGASRIYRQGKKHRPLFSEELDEVLREDVPQARPASRPPRSVAAVSTPAVRRNSQKKPGFFRTVKIVLKVLFDEAAAFFKKQFAGKNARIAATAAVVCIVGLAAIISVAAVSTRKDDSGADGAALNSPAESDAYAYSADSEDSADDTDGPAVTDSGANSLMLSADTDDKNDSSASTAEDGEDTDDAEETEAEALNTVTVTFWDKDSITIQTGAATVGEFLSEAGIGLSDTQYANIDTALPIAGDITLTADVITYDTVTVDEVLEYDTEYRTSDALPEGSSEITQYGVNGSQTREFTVTYVNGAEVDRVQSASWINSYPTTQIVTNGTGAGNAVTDTLPGDITVSPEGGTFIGADGVERAYLYYIDVRATCYYVGGTTASGLPADEGVIAVDPSVIPLGTRVYVTGSYGDFGERIAADTGGNIVGYTIDVCIDPSNPLAGSFGWRDMRVYILA